MFPFLFFRTKSAERNSNHFCLTFNFLDVYMIMKILNQLNIRKHKCIFGNLEVKALLFKNKNIPIDNIYFGQMSLNLANCVIYFSNNVHSSEKSFFRSEPHHYTVLNFKFSRGFCK